MPYTIEPLNKKQKAPSFHELLVPIDNIINHVPILQSKGNRSLQMNFEQQLKALIFYHLEEHSSGRHLLEVLEKDDFAKTNIAPPDGIKKSSFFEA
ncbi:MAG: IS4 family transposase, partial [wastewater metagenome]|nr:IS4 family transposase [Candidatus Loosdrechtia aerotolerans]